MTRPPVEDYVKLVSIFCEVAGSHTELDVRETVSKLGPNIKDIMFQTDNPKVVLAVEEFLKQRKIQYKKIG